MVVNVYFLSAVAGVVVAAWEGFIHWRRTRKSNIEDIIHHALSGVVSDINEIKTTLAIISTKVDPMWTGWNATIAHNAAVLHHPEPSRIRVDELLDFLRAGTITSEEVAELRGYLEIIKHWEPGVSAPFVIFQGEQPAAASMLSALDVIHSETEDGLPNTPADGSEEEGTGLPG